MIKNIIFDMGNVLIYFDRNKFMDAIGLTDPAERRYIANEVYLSLEWSRLDRGSLTEAEAADIMCARMPEKYHDAVNRLVKEWDRPILPIAGMAELVKELKAQGYGIYLLSNASCHQHDYWPEIPGHEYFDGTLISADVKLVKPQPEIYTLLCEKFSLKPEECVFIDDSSPNAEGAFLCGMEAIVFHDDAEELKAKLRQLNIKI